MLYYSVWFIINYCGDGTGIFLQPQDRLDDVVAQGLALPFVYTDDEINGFSKATIDAFTADV